MARADTLEERVLVNATKVERETGFAAIEETEVNMLYLLAMVFLAPNRTGAELEEH